MAHREGDRDRGVPTVYDHLTDGSPCSETIASASSGIALASDFAAALITPLPHTVTVRRNDIPQTLDGSEMLVTTTPTQSALDSPTLGLKPEAARARGSGWIGIDPHVR